MIRRVVVALACAGLLVVASGSSALAATDGWYLRRVPQFAGSVVDFAYTQPATSVGLFVQVKCQQSGVDTYVNAGVLANAGPTRPAGTYEVTASCPPGAGDASLGWVMSADYAAQIATTDSVTYDPGYTQPPPAPSTAAVVSLDPVQWEPLVYGIGLLVFVGAALMVGSWRS